MAFVQKLIGASLRPRIRAKARGKTLVQLGDQLEASYAGLAPLYARAKDTPANREAFNHWLGIERWSLSRLRVALGDDFDPDGYRKHRLPDGASLDELREAFAAVRSDSVALAREYARTGVDPAFTIPSNDLGDLSVAEWFEYIDDHSKRERIRLRVEPG